MKKVYKKLTEEQISRGIIFSSCLSKYRTEQQDDNMHEVSKDNKQQDEYITNLLNDKHFNSSPWNYNIVRRF